MYPSSASTLSPVSKKVINESWKIVMSLYAPAGYGPFAQTMFLVRILDLFHTKALTSCSCERNFFFHAQISESLFHQQISKNHCLYPPYTYYRIESKIKEEG